MTQATEKQINFAKILGIEEPEQYNLETLKGMIDAKLKVREAKKAQPQPSNAVLSPIMSNIVITRTEKPHSYEFGKAGARHKIYYGTIPELLDHIKLLTTANLMDYQEIPEELTQ